MVKELLVSRDTLRSRQLLEVNTYLLHGAESFLRS